MCKWEELNCFMKLSVDILDGVKLKNKLYTYIRGVLTKLVRIKQFIKNLLLHHIAAVATVWDFPT